MKKRLWGMAFFGLLLSLGVWSYFANQPVPPPSVSARPDFSPASRDKDPSSPPLGERVQRTPASSKPAAPSAESDFQMELSTDSLCWKNLLAQSDETGFRDRFYKNVAPLIGKWPFEKEKAEAATIDPAASKDAEVDSSPAHFFLSALAQEGSLVGTPAKTSSNKNNTEKALHGFLKAHRLDPRNSAPLLYAATLAESLGRSEQAEELLNQAQSTDRFDTYLGDIGAALFREVRSPSDMIAALNLLQHFPATDHSRLKKFLIEKKAYEFGHQMMAASLDPERTIEGVEFMALDYAFGAVVVRASPRGYDGPHFNDLLIEKSKTNFLSSLEQALGDHCHMDVLNEMAGQMKSYPYKLGREGN